MRKKIIPNYIMEIFHRQPLIGRTELAKAAGIPEGEARFFCRVFSEMTSKIKYKGRGIALFDWQFPFHDLAATEVVFEFLEDFKPDWLLLMGDQMEMNSISSFN